jgi:hypothetical protein
MYPLGPPACTHRQRPLVIGRHVHESLSGNSQPAPGKFRVGQAVRLKHGFRDMIGEVVEDRGPIAPGGRRLYGVRIDLAPWNENPLELTEDSLEAVDGGADGVLPSDSKEG